MLQVTDHTCVPRCDRSRGVALVCALLGFASLSGLISCTETNLYSASRERARADRIALEGRVCTRDPTRAEFPVRLIMLVDQASGPQYESGDGGTASFAARRTRVLSEYARRVTRTPQAKVAVIGYGGRPRKLAPSEGNFTNNSAVVRGAIETLAQSEGCTDEELCRDYRGALDLAESLIEGDLAQLPSGRRAITQYVVLMVNAGPQDPPTFPNGCCALGGNASQCCEDKDDASCERIRQCQRQSDQAQVNSLREMVRREGAAGLRLHTVHLAARFAALDDDKKDDKSPDASLEATMRQMALAGGGVYKRLNAPGGLSPSLFEVLQLRTVLEAKRLIVANHNAIPTPDGPRVDSDGDGLSDAREREGETSPIKRDTDDDGITDRVERLVGFSATEPNDPSPCEDLEADADTDLEGLTDCDEVLLGTDPTLVDSDGDGISDRIEVFQGTDYLAYDANDDTDGDGVSNGTELQQRTDPRSTDLDQHLSHAYRYDVENLGFITDLTASEPAKITGVEIVELTRGSTPGLGALRYDPEANTLRWRDPLDAQFGRPVDVDSADDEGRLKLPSNSHVPAQGEQGRQLTVEVTPEALPPRRINESLRVSERRRNCLEYDIRNVQLMETRELEDGTPAGRNDIVLYLSQAPQGDLRRVGPFRRAQIPVRFFPPDEREPAAPSIRVNNREFVRPEIQSLE